MSGPEGWIEAWRHNDRRFFDTPDLAWSVVPDGDRPDFELYAYGLFPWRFEHGELTAVDAATCAVTPLSADFEPLGYDVVSRTVGFFECSPLSCNSWAEEVETNEFCLVDSAERARELASIAEGEGCEPGDYYVLRVWRRRRGVLIGNAKLSTEDIEGIDRVRASLVEAILDGDPSGYARCFTPDGVVMHPDSPPVRGRDELESCAALRVLGVDGARIPVRSAVVRYRFDQEGEAAGEAEIAEQEELGWRHVRSLATLMEELRASGDCPIATCGSDAIVVFFRERTSGDAPRG